MKRNVLSVVLIIVITAVFAAWLVMGDEHYDVAGGHDEHGQMSDESHEEEVIKGPHNGRLLLADDFSVEITIFETGLPPEFHVYAYDGGKAISPDKFTLSIELARLGGKVDRINFKPQQDYLRGDGEVVEPHSFDVTVRAEYKGQRYSWAYENYEGRTEIAAAMASEAGIITSIAGAVSMQETLILSGRVETDPNRVSHVRARFPGVVEKVHRSLGDVVKRGQRLATIQSNESLQSYQLRAPIGGVIVQRDIQIGEFTADAPLFIIADLSQVWVELDVFGSDLAKLKVGQSVRVKTFNDDVARGEIEWISPLAVHASQSVRVRVPLANPEGTLRPGQFVRGEVTVADHAVSLAVRQSAIQTFRDFQVVFVRVQDSYEVRMLTLGRQNNDWAEVLGGLDVGMDYVSENSYLLKADIEKSGASHDH